MRRLVLAARLKGAQRLKDVGRGDRRERANKMAALKLRMGADAVARIKCLVDEEGTHCVESTRAEEANGIAEGNHLPSVVGVTPYSFAAMGQPSSSCVCLRMAPWPSGHTGRV